MTVERRRLKENIVILFIVGGLALNYPLLALANHLLLPLGIPLLYFYIFVVWLFIIALMYTPIAANSATLIRSIPGPDRSRHAQSGNEDCPGRWCVVYDRKPDWQTALVPVRFLKKVDA